MNDRFKHGTNSTFNLGYHLIWCTKYRRRLLIGDIEARLVSLLHDKAKSYGVEIETVEVMPDHVHVFVKTVPVNCPHLVVKGLKGFTSRMLRKEFEILRTRVPTLWTNSYYVESIGHISESTVKRYIEDQKGR